VPRAFVLLLLRARHPLQRARDFGAAEKIYREDLEHNPESGRALFGLQAALAAHARHREAGALQRRVDNAWRAADVPLAAMQA